MSELADSVSSPGDTSTSHEQVQQSYAAAVSKRPSLKKHDIEVSVIDGVPTIEVPNSVISDSVSLWEDFLVGRFSSSAPHVAKLHVIVNKIWTLGDKSIKVDVFENNLTEVKFRIRDPSTRMRILRRGMWIISKWSLILEETQHEIKSMPMIRKRLWSLPIHGFPQYALVVKNGAIWRPEYSKRWEFVTNKVVELEEGELVIEEQGTVSPSVLITKADGLSETQEDGWSQVSPGKVSRSNEKNKKSLTYGQVEILAASRFSVLSEQEEEEKAEDTLNDTNLIENSKKRRAYSGDNMSSKGFYP
ncbi:unnamed protein product [Arabidopsis halleri]